MSGLARLLQSFLPDVVVTVHATPALAMSALAAMETRLPPHTTVVTDFVAHSQWLAPNIDRYCVADDEVKNEFVRRDSRKVRPPEPEERTRLAKHDFGPNLVYVEYSVELRPEQIRELRTRDRLIDTLRILGGVTAAALAGFLFLRLDEWTRGYLTRWLAVGALALAAGAAVALYFV